jgi:hypothetical protein
VGPKNAADFLQGCQVVFDVLDYVGRENEIELLIREGQRADIAQTYLAEPLIGTPPDRFGAVVDPGHPGKAEIAQQPEIAARACTDVEDFHVPGKIDASYDVREQQSPTNEPPVISFDGRLDGVAGNVHRRAMTKVTC